MQDRERIEALEKRVGKFESEVNENLTMVLGQVWKQIEIARSIRGDLIGFKALVSLEFEEVDQRFDGLSKSIQTVLDRQDFLEKRIDGVDSKLDQRFDGLSKRIDGVDSKLDQRFDGLSKRIDGVDSKLDQRFDGLSKRIDGVDSKLDQILALLPKTED